MRHAVILADDTWVIRGRSIRTPCSQIRLNEASNEILGRSLGMVYVDLFLPIVNCNYRGIPFI